MATSPPCWARPAPIGLDRLLGPKNQREPNRPRDLVMAMIVSRVIAPASKLATAKALDPATAASSLGVELGLGEVDERRTLRRARLAA